MGFRGDETAAQVLRARSEDSMTGMELLVALGTGLVAGLASIPHCAAMCGPLAGFACGRRPGKTGAVRYQFGRTLGYLALGAIAGHAGGLVTGGMSSVWVSAILSWSFAAALGFAAFRLWHLGSPKRRSASAPLQIGTEQSRPSLAERALSRLPRDPLVFGVATALLPCGALAAAVLLAAGTSTVLGGALLMAGFVTSSGVALLGAAWLVGWLTNVGRPTALKVVSAALMVGAVMLLVRPVPTLGGQEPACCEAMEE